jgi:hypothetical protein
VDDHRSAARAIGADGRPVCGVVQRQQADSEHCRPLGGSAVMATSCGLAPPWSRGPGAADLNRYLEDVTSGVTIVPSVPDPASGPGRRGTHGADAAAVDADEEGLGAVDLIAVKAETFQPTREHQPMTIRRCTTWGPRLGSLPRSTKWPPEYGRRPGGSFCRGDHLVRLLLPHRQASMGRGAGHRAPICAVRRCHNGSVSPGVVGGPSFQGVVDARAVVTRLNRLEFEQHRGWRAKRDPPRGVQRFGSAASPDRWIPSCGRCRWS